MYGTIHSWHVSMNRSSYGLVEAFLKNLDLLREDGDERLKRSALLFLLEIRELLLLKWCQADEALEQ